jgi:hypothetical protein
MIIRFVWSIRPQLRGIKQRMMMILNKLHVYVGKKSFPESDPYLVTYGKNIKVIAQGRPGHAKSRFY